MTKTKKTLVTNPDQLGLFDRLLQEKEERVCQRPGRLNIDVQFNAAIEKAINHYITQNPGKSLDSFCEELSSALGISIKTSTLRNFMAESHPHRWPGSWVAAICLISGCNAPAEVTNDTIGVYTLPGPDALRAEIQKHDEKIRLLQAEKRKRQLFLQELEGNR
jgi:hypothetical protein